MIDDSEEEKELEEPIRTCPLNPNGDSSACDACSA
jgi:hypothetical protein